MSIEARNLVWGVGHRTVVDGVSLVARPGRLLGLIGPNGSGKTSLLRLLAGLRTPRSGQVLLGGQDIRRMPRRQVAQRMAFMEQHATTGLNLSP